MTSSSHQTLERIARRVPVPEPAYDRLLRRGEQKERNRRISAAVIGIAVTLISLVGLTWVLRSSGRPTDEPIPTPAPKPPGIFSEVGGWIVYGPLFEKCEPSPCGNEEGIWAVDPTRPGDPTGQIQLSTDNGTPLAWSSDGSKLLILRTRNVPDQASLGSNLFVLNSDGTETRLTEGDAWISGGSFSPDGSHVVYAVGGGVESPGIFMVDTAGGTPLLLIAGGDLQAPTFSPDGSKIAYFACCRSFDGNYRLRVMNADGSGSRDLNHDTYDYAGHTLGLVWSPDGTRLAIDLGGSIFTVQADGSDLTLVVPNGGSPNWSPDGSRLAYDFEAVSYPPGPHLEIVDANGKFIRRFHNARSGPWNPLVQSEPVVAEVPLTSGGPPLTSLLVVVAMLALVPGAVLIRRRRAGARALGREREGTVLRSDRPRAALGMLMTFLLLVVAVSCSTSSGEPGGATTGVDEPSSPIDGTYGFGPAGLRFLGGGWSAGPIPMRSGTFSVSGDRLTLTQEDCAADGTYEWALQAGVLSLTHMEDECYLRTSAVEGEWTAIPSVEQAKEGDVALLPNLHPTNFFGQIAVANLESVTVAAHHAIVDGLLMLYFSPSSFVGTPGQTLKLTIHNREKSKSHKNGLIRHNFTLPEQGINKDIAPQESATVTVTFPQSGSLTFYCSFHVRLNQLGQLTVAG